MGTEDMKYPWEEVKELVIERMEKGKEDAEELDAIRILVKNRPTGFNSNYSVLDNLTVLLKYYEDKIALADISHLDD